MMKRLPIDIFQTYREPKGLLKRLRQLRYPLTLGEDEKNPNILKPFPGQKRLKSQWIRKNDKSGLNISFTSFSLKDFYENIKSLERLYTQIKKEETLWKN